MSQEILQAAEPSWAFPGGGDGHADARVSPPFVERVFRKPRLLRGDTGVNIVQTLDKASWLWLGAANDPLPPEGVFLRFRLPVETPESGEKVRIDVSADERFALLLDGACIARGPHRCTPEHWLYQTYDIVFSPGRHLLEAVVWRLGDKAPSAQTSVRGGFALSADGDAFGRFATGAAPWVVARLHGTVPGGADPEGVATRVGTPFCVSGTSYLDEIPEPEAWESPTVVRRPVWSRPTRNYWGGRAVGWQLYPSPLPDQLSVRRAVQVDETFPLVIPARTKRSFIWDLGEYYCAFPELVVDGGAGAVLRWGWAEGLRGPDGLKLLNRNAWRGGEFMGFTDEFRPDGRTGAHFSVPWWRSGRFCRLEVETADAPLRLHAPEFVETRYPAPVEGKFASDDESLADIQRICVRGLQMCMHETYFDCPHYEQLMYIGDTRVQALAAAVMSSDPRLSLRAAELFDESRREDGVPAMYAPSRNSQESATYALVWPLMLRDAMMLHDCRDWLRARAPGMRHCLHGIATYADARGLLRGLPGWSFIDWALAWNDRKGVPPGGFPDEASSAPADFFHVLALRAAAEVDSALGQPHLAAHWRAEARRTAAAAVEAYWDEARGMVADDEAHTGYSEHAQCLALLSGVLTGERRRRALLGLLEAPDLARCTVYFSHYLFETYLQNGLPDIFLRRLDLWRDFASRGLRTPLEAPDSGKNGQKEPRSDCHAWGSHPLWHLHSGVAGVRPAAPFYGAVSVSPNPGPLRMIRSSTPTPRGPVRLDLRFEGRSVSGTVELPPGLPGVFRWRGRTITLEPGRATIVARAR